ncbi:M3 family metallopeptidase [Sphingomonas sp. S-NIH.Pt15_0812]|uniref:M3 family metallopeptidase n=1 Tax=Sphingomonas sp. S-NIH.Pt15_0812 TaxID=1920129 RepID=UPI000F7E0A3F|nr:M3 family metallopeptidase [Sphingomonas sp. S-NIH.Pt15_0812]RSU48925.1 dipeptidyl carboxypeptidase II [Sphingomonas sp. S-NIH.Pt15_0812]
MTRSLLLRSCAAACLLAACITAAAADAQSARVNPLTVQSDLPFQAPRFDRIQDSDYQPAIERGIAEQAAEMTRIANDPAAPTFDNTIVAMERSGRILDRAAQAFSAVVGANTNPTLDKVQEAVAPKLAAHSDSIFLNPRLFARVKSLYDRRAALKLTPEQAQVLDITYNNFIHAGAKLSAADQAKLRVLNGKLSTLETAFQQKLLAAAKGGALVVDDKARLAGLDEAQIAAAGQAAQERGLTGKYLLPLQNTTQQPMLQSLTDRATRQALFDASWNRAEHGDANDTRATIVQLADLRAQKAQLLGYPNYAAYVLYDQMAKTPQAAKAFMQRLIPATAAEQKREAAEIQKVITANGGDFALKPWDWDRYAEMVRKAKYDLDENEVKPYFEIDRVLRDGVFYAANQLYGLTFKERKDLPVYQPDVRVFTVYDQDGSELGVMYFDYWKRDNKNGGAWMSNFVGQSKLLGTKPVIYNVANFTKPAPGQPALISFDDVTTMFHEFGHALHGLFANQTYPTVSGTNTARDWVEFPSQFNEHWALDPKVLANYAKDYRTGAPMPAALVTKVKNAAKFNQGYALGELIASAMLDQDWHSLPASAGPQDVDAFEAKSLAAMGLDTADVPPRYRSSYFLHIWANGYSAGYYAYLWTQMLDNDAYAWFEKHGGMTRANGQRFRDMILSKGHSEDYGPMFRAFYGKDPDIGPMLEDRGLASSAN